MSSIRVTRSSRATLRPESVSIPPTDSLKRPRSPSSDSELDSLRPSKRSCLQAVSSSELSDDDDDMPSLQSLSPSPIVNPAVGTDVILAASKELENLVNGTHRPELDPAPVSMVVDTVTDFVTVTHRPTGVVEIPVTQNADAEDEPNSDPEYEPDPTAADVSHDQFEGVNYLPFQALERAVTFAAKSDPTNRRFAIRTVPSNADWGSAPHTEKVLCVGERPLTVWLVGKVVTMWFYNMQGEPQPRVNIGFTLPHKGDEDALRRLLGHARPHRDELPPVIYASRFQSRQKKGETGTSIVPFKNIYDARTRFRAKTEMPLLPSSHIGRNDLVLVEAYFNRWKTAKDKKNRNAWTLWDIGFELQCISLLCDSPPNADDDEAVPNPDVPDDM